MYDLIWLSIKVLATGYITILTNDNCGSRLSEHRALHLSWSLGLPRPNSFEALLNCSTGRYQLPFARYQFIKVRAVENALNIDN